MSDIQKEQVKKIVYTFASLSNVNDNKVLDGLIEKLVLMNENGAIDYKLDVGKQNNYDINRKSANGSVVSKFEGKIVSYDSGEKRGTFSTEKGKSL